mmetsp:Transcript_71445/g.163745  ORF Transcript_71445/g.163745 Transcript_71445/m.163745 type:complete len:218 (-) Transcript_71445:732-1385(-)
MACKRGSGGCAMSGRMWLGRALRVSPAVSRRETRWWYWTWMGGRRKRTLPHSRSARAPSRWRCSGRQARRMPPPSTISSSPTPSRRHQSCTTSTRRGCSSSPQRAPPSSPRTSSPPSSLHGHQGLQGHEGLQGQGCHAPRPGRYRMPPLLLLLPDYSRTPLQPRTERTQKGTYRAYMISRSGGRCSGCLATGLWWRCCTRPSNSTRPCSACPTPCWQ